MVHELLPALTAAVRALVHARAMHALCPTNAFVGDLVARRWADCRALLGPSFRGGRLEALVNEHAAVRARLAPANDNASTRCVA